MLQLVTGDAGGEMAVSSVSYSNATHKLEAVDLLANRKAHKAAVSQLEPTQADGVVVSGGLDGAVIFWDVDTQAMLLKVEEHSDPVLAVRFADRFAWLATASKSELLLWETVVQPNEDYQADKENDPDQGNGKVPARFIVQAK